jgi:translation initiation factor IF-2
MKKIEDLKKVAEAPRAVFPCVLRIVQVFNKRSPLVIGVDVIDGQLRLNTPICVVGEDVCFQSLSNGFVESRDGAGKGNEHRAQPQAETGREKGRAELRHQD